MGCNGVLESSRRFSEHAPNLLGGEKRKLAITELRGQREVTVIKIK